MRNDFFRVPPSVGDGPARPALHRVGGRRAAGLLWLAGLAATAAPVQAAVFIDTVLATLPANSGSVVYTTPDAPGFTMTVVENLTATMTGSDLFDYEGLWLGADGTGGRYSFNFNQPVSSLSFSFIALTSFGAGLQETVTSFVASSATTAVLGGAGGTTLWNGSTLTPLEEDSRGVLTFTATLPGGFSSLRFDHLQPAQLQGFIVERIEFTPIAAPVPEPGPALLFFSGLLMAGWRLRRLAEPA